MSLPFFSVIIPVYNVERYLTRCIESVLAQTFTNFEIICVNDGSQDASLAILQSYSDSRLHIITKQNEGLAAARNTGIAASRGLFVALLDADDFWAPEKLKKHFKHFQLHPSVDISYCPSLFVDEDDQLLGIGQFPKLKDISAGDIYCRNPVGNGSAAVIKRSLLCKVVRKSFDASRTIEHYFDSSMRQSEDVEFWLRCALEANAVFEGIDEPLTYYRVNDGGLSANVAKQLKSWQFINEKLSQDYPEFFKKWYSLAEAYQYRYLARRAVQSGEGVKAIQLIHKALSTNIKILINEPARTLVSYGCAFLALMPRHLYNALAKRAMDRMSNSSQALTSHAKTLITPKKPFNATKGA
jgi:glycosyltransferase involved in cell wall biosynthesis